MRKCNQCNETDKSKLLPVSNLCVKCFHKSQSYEEIYNQKLDILHMKWKTTAPFIEVEDVGFDTKVYFEYDPGEKGAWEFGLQITPDIPEHFAPNTIDICGVEVNDFELHNAILEYLGKDNLVELMHKKHNEEKE